jgi:hypothetical protein
LNSFRLSWLYLVSQVPLALLHNRVSYHSDINNRTNLSRTPGVSCDPAPRPAPCRRPSGRPHAAPPSRPPPSRLSSSMVTPEPPAQSSACGSQGRGPPSSRPALPAVCRPHAPGSQAASPTPGGRRPAGRPPAWRWSVGGQAGGWGPVGRILEARRPRQQAGRHLTRAG